MHEASDILDNGADGRDNDCPKVMRSMRLTRRQAHVLGRLAELNGESQSSLLRRVLTQGLLAELGADEATRARFGHRVVTK